MDIADKVGMGVQKIFEELGSSGQVDLVQVAQATFWPVNQAMYGSQTMSPTKTPNAEEWFYQFDEHIPEITGGVPLKMFPDSKEAYDKIVDMFKASIDAGNHADAMRCPVLHARLNVDDIPAKYSNEDMAKFMVSLFWAPQANTLPMTWWTLVEILRNPSIKAKVEREVRETSSFRSQPDAQGHWHVDDDDLPYTRACMYEVFRMYIANLTHRKVARDIPLKSNGVWYRVPKGDMLTVTSYLRHYDPDVYPNPEQFRPERWLDAQGKLITPKVGDYFPFAHVSLSLSFVLVFVFGLWGLQRVSGKGTDTSLGVVDANVGVVGVVGVQGRYSCSGKFLAQLEIPILVGLFFRDFDTRLIDPVPAADWSTVVASVRPEGWPHQTNCRVQFQRRP